MTASQLKDRFAARTTPILGIAIGRLLPQIPCMSSVNSEMVGTLALYRHHLERLEAIRAGAAQRVYTPEEVAAFEAETAQLKAKLEVYRAHNPA